MQRDNFTTSCANWRAFISFSCLIAQARISSTMLKSGDSRHPCLIPDLRGKLSVFHHWAFAVSFHIYGFYYIKVLSYYFVVFHKECGILSNALSTSVERIMFYPYILLMWCITLSFQMLQHCISGKNCTWSLCIMHVIYCWIPLDRILLTIFASMFTRNIVL